MAENKDEKKGSGYNAAAVQKEIEKDKRIGGKEAKAIHGLLKGWRGDGEPTNADKLTAIADMVDGLVTRFDAYCSRNESRADAQYGSWAAWNDVQTKLLQKRNAAERDVQKFWKAEDLAKRQNAEKRLVKALQDIEDHKRDYVPSTSSFVWGKRP